MSSIVAYHGPSLLLVSALPWECSGLVVDYKTLELEVLGLIPTSTM